MQIKIISQRDNVLLSRKELIYELIFEKEPPSKEDVKKAVSKSAKTAEDLVVVKGIKCSFGLKRADVEAYIYKDNKQLGLIEPKQKKAEGKGKEGKKDAKEEKKEAKNE